MSGKSLQFPMLLDGTTNHPRLNKAIEFLKRPFTIRLGFICVLLGLLRAIFVHSFPEHADHLSISSTSVLGFGGRRSLETKLLDINNATLGFQKVYAIGMAERTDKRDTFALIARLTGFDIEWIDGVIGDSISPKAIPENFSRTKWKNNKKTIACWRAHINVAQKMISENIQSALILEDDADWDVFLRAQLTEYARGSSMLEASTRDVDAPLPPYTDSPFGDDWDLQWLGNCGTEANEKLEIPHFVIGEDPTVIPDALFQRNRGIPNFTPPALSESNYTRAIFPGIHTWCTYGYALSLRGAERSLYLQSVADKAHAIDQAMDGFCSDKKWGFNCLMAYPPLIGTHRPAGDPAKDSDRDDRVKGGFRTKPSTVNIVYSMILNAKALLAGNTTVYSQWPGQTMADELEIGTKLPHGRVELIKPEHYGDKPWEPRFGGPKYRPPW